MRDEDFERDDRKAADNVRKHDVAFELAREAFDDPDFVATIEPDSFEDRYKRLGLRNGKIYVIVYRERGSRLRTISARPATKHEQRQYSDGQA